MEITVKQARLRKGIAVVMALVVLAGMAWIAATHAPSLLYSSDSRNWPKTSGTITRSAVETVHQRKSHNYHVPNLMYEYSVSGAKYVGSRFRFQDKGVESEFGGITEFLDKFPQGKTIEVFYNPKLPGMAVLQPGGESERLALTVVIILLGTLIGFGLLFLLIRDVRRMNALIKR